MTEEFSSQDRLTPSSSCEQSLTRAEFITRVVKGAALTGGLIAAPKILDKFFVPPAFAGASSCSVSAGTTIGGPDTVQDLGGGRPNLYVVCSNNTGFLSVCSGGTDSAPGFTCP